MAILANASFPNLWKLVILSVNAKSIVAGKVGVDGVKYWVSL
jgi:hypothetical protein